MLQPFEKLTPLLMGRLEKSGAKYFVTQYYPRGINHFEEKEKIPIVISVYDDLGLAKTHLNALKADQYASIIHLNEPVHLDKIWNMVRGQTKFTVYWAITRSVAELENRINLKYRDHMHRYVRAHTSWRDPNIRPGVQLIFSELYINLKHGSEHIRIKFEDIENS